MIELTRDGLRAIFPRAPQPVIEAFLAKQDVLAAKGVNHTRQRLAYCFTQLEHECVGFTIMRENLGYSAQRMVKVWPSRFATAEAAEPYAHQPMKLANKVYGGRMGNRPGTDDGANYIGRGGPMVTGRDGYLEVAAHSGVPIHQHPDWAERPEHQPAIAAGFVDWKGLNARADVGDFKGYVRVWNGGLVGFADREHLLAGNDPAVARLKTVELVKSTTDALPGKPPTPAPPKQAVDAATQRERTTVKTGAGAIVVATANEGAKTTTQVPATAPLMPSFAAFMLVGVGLAIVVLMAILIAKKRAAVAYNWK